MFCWTATSLLIAIIAFGIGIATDFSDNPPRFWHRPRSYGLAILLAAALWSIGWLIPPFWHHRGAIDKADMASLTKLGIDFLRRLPSGVGVLLFGLGIYIGSGAWTRVGDHPHCRSCGFAQVTPGRVLTPKCPECGANWAWFGSTAIGAPHFNRPRATIGASLALLGLTGIVLHLVL